MKRVCMFLLLFVTGLVGASKGKDGDLTVSANTAVNYFALLTNINTVGGVTLTVNNINNLDDASGTTYADTNLSTNDLIMLYQAQGATFSDDGNTATYGAFNLGNAGRYELYEVISVAGNDILVADNGTLCDSTSLIYSYDLGITQVIRVPQFENLTINASGSIITNAWNGSTGGVVAIDVNDTLTVNGSITAANRGFRGGVIDNATTGAGTDVTLFRGAANTNGAEKGESILGFQTVYDANNGRYGRGAPANGGGGGNAHNGGGGGGANGDNGTTWNGQGNPDNVPANWTAAWNLDPTLNSATTSSGGGRGGYTYGSADRNAITEAPGLAVWGGNNRRERGGLGGRPLPFDDVGRLFFGGGGGAGDGNNGRAGAGGNGGGLIYLITDTLTGNGTINANGQIGFDTADNGGNNDAPGGGGAGGTIVVSANTTAASVNLTANGGKGGDQLMIGNENEGPGGGGGGGVISITSGTPTRSALGGANGVSESDAVTEFTANGATIGATGQPNEVTSAVGDLPICVATADLSITKSDSADPVNPGDPITYTIRVDNAGPVAALNVVATETLPAGVTFVATSGCTEDPNGVPNCTLGDIAFGGFAEYTVTVTVDNSTSGVITNNVSVTSDTPDPDTSDNNTDEDTTVNPLADLSISKIDNVDPVNPGAPLTYTIRVDNAGPSTATNVIATETLPAGVTFVSTSGCSNDPNGVPACNLGDINAGSFAQYTVTVNVNNNATGTLINDVSVTSDIPDPDTSNNNTDEETTVNPFANLSITKTDNIDPVDPGAPLTYTIRVENAGPATATNVVATDVLPAGVTLVSTSGCAEDPAGVPTCSLGNILSGGFAQYTVAVNVNNNASGTLTNNVSVTSSTPDPDTSDNSTDETTDVNAEANLSITKIDSADPVNPGDPLTYTIQVNNAGPSTAVNVVATEMLPAGVTLVSTSGCTEDPAGVPTCSLGNIASGGLAQYTVAVTVNNNVTGTLTNNVSVTSDTTDPDTSDNNTDETTDVNDAANLSITKIDSIDPVTPGDPLTYTITVDNAGPATAVNVVVTDTLPAGVTLVSTTGCTEDPAGVPTCSLGDIASGGQAQYTVAVQVNANASGTLTNTVSVTSDTPDPDTTDNNTDEDTIVGDAANLSITKIDSVDPVNPGDALTYTIEVNNAGPSTATNVVVTEALPAGVTLVSTAGCSEDPMGVPSCNLGDIISSGSAQYTVAVTVNNDASGVLTNNVSVTSDLPDPDTSDNDTDEETTIDTEADLSISKTDSVDPVTPGDALTYTVRVDNAGPSTATNVIVTETLPADVTFVSTAGCSTDPNGVPSCNLGDIVAGGFAEYTVAVTVNNDASGTLTNNVSVTSDTTDPDTSNNNTDETTGVIDVANLSIIKTDSADPVSPGDALTYTILVNNAGPATATNVVVTETLPAGVTLVSTAGCTEDPTGVPTCSLGDIASGGSAQFTVAVTVDVNTNGTLTNNVSVTSDLPDPDTSDNDTDEETIVGDAANLSITKTDSVDPVNPGDALTYTIRVDNAGPSTATNVVVTESLPADVTLVSTAGCAEDPNGVPSCNLGDIPSGGFATYTVAVTVNNDASGTLSNNVSVTSDLPDPDTSDNDTDEETGVNAPSLNVVKEFSSNDDEDASGTVSLNDTLNFTITATNDGDSPLNNVVVSDPMITPDSITCPTLAIGAECQLVGTYVVQQSDIDNGEINNTGTGDSDETDPETDVIVVVVGSDPDLSIDKTLTGNADEDSNNYVSLGDTVTFTIVATNTGNVTLNNVLVEDDMITPGGITCLSVDVGDTCVLVGTYVIQQSDVDNGELTNIATAGSDETGQQSDTTDLTINVGLPPEPAMVPSTTFWGQLLMLLMMSILGMYFVRKER